jgi:hypothetical protein
LQHVLGDLPAAQHDAARQPGHVGGVVGDALEVVVELEQGDQQAHVVRHGVVQRDQAHDLGLDVHLGAVHHVVALDDAPGQLRVARAQRLAGVLEGLEAGGRVGRELAAQAGQLGVEGLAHPKRPEM